MPNVGQGTCHGCKYTVVAAAVSVWCGSALALPRAGYKVEDDKVWARKLFTKLLYHCDYCAEYHDVR